MERREGETIDRKIQRDEHSEDYSDGPEDMQDSADELVEEDKKRTAYMWDSMDEEDRENTTHTLGQHDSWIAWKCKDKKWSNSLKTAGYHQLLCIKQDIQDECWGSKI